MLITKDNTEFNGWKLDELDLKYGILSYNKTFIINNNIFYCVLTNSSNMWGVRDWSCHVDNCDHDSIGFITVNSYDQIDKFLDLLVEDCYNEVEKQKPHKCCFTCKWCALSKGIGNDYCGICKHPDYNNKKIEAKKVQEKNGCFDHEFSDLFKEDES